MVSKASSVGVTGELAAFAEAFRDALIGQGFTPLSAANQLRVMAHVSRWLAGRGMHVQDFAGEQVAEFLADRRGQGYTCWLSDKGIAPLLRFLRDRGLAPAVIVSMPGSSPAEVLLAEYRRYLMVERGLADSTVRHRLDAAELFLMDRRRSRTGGDISLGELSAAEVVDFVTGQCRDRSVGWSKNMVSDLRSLLRFLHVAGHLRTSLVSAVPAVAGWRGGSLPRAVAPDQVAGLLASCDRRQAAGRRDYAILLLLARLGLRAGEVAALELADVDWRAGVILIRGKGRRVEQLPLPVDVGEALAGYLRRGRPRCGEPHVFLRVRAPRGPLTSVGITTIVGAACDRAGIPRFGAHRLRHTAATQMLSSGAPLAEVGQVLRHRNAATTAIYAKVDRAALRPLALPWPGGAV